MSIKPDRSLIDGIIIRNRFYDFSIKDISKNISSVFNIAITLPNEFKELPYTYKMLKFPSHPRPAYILSNKNYSINITFSEINFPSKYNIKNNLEIVQNNMKRMNPSYVFDEITDVKLDKYCVIRQEFSGIALDDEIYNLNCFIHIKERLLIVGFICPLRLKDNWKNIFLKIAESITIEKENI